MAYWGGNMNYVGGAMSARAKIVAKAKRLVLASPDGKSMVNQALRELGTSPLGPREKGFKRGPRSTTVPKPPKNQGVYKSGPRKGQAKTRTTKQIEAANNLVAYNLRKKEFGNRQTMPMAVQYI